MTYRYVVRSETLVKWFLEHGADPNGGYEYCTALSYAAFRGSIDVLRTLLSHGGDLQRGDVLHQAVERESDCRAVVTFLLERGAPVNYLRFDGQQPYWSVFHRQETPLHRAVELDKKDIVAKLIEFGADPEKGDNYGKSVRELAEELGREYMLSYPGYL